MTIFDHRYLFLLTSLTVFILYYSYGISSSEESMESYMGNTPQSPEEETTETHNREMNNNSSAEEEGEVIPMEDLYECLIHWPEVRDTDLLRPYALEYLKPLAAQKQEPYLTIYKEMTKKTKKKKRKNHFRKRNP